MGPVRRRAQLSVALGPMGQKAPACGDRGALAPGRGGLSAAQSRKRRTASVPFAPPEAKGRSRGGCRTAPTPAGRARRARGVPGWPGAAAATPGIAIAGGGVTARRMRHWAVGSRQGVGPATAPCREGPSVRVQERSATRGTGVEACPLAPRPVGERGPHMHHGPDKLQGGDRTPHTGGDRPPA